MYYFHSIVVYTIFTTRTLLSSIRKDILSTFQQNLVIHRFKCQYEVDYVGKTIHRLGMRIT